MISIGTNDSYILDDQLRLIIKNQSLQLNALESELYCNLYSIRMRCDYNHIIIIITYNETIKTLKCALRGKTNARHARQK